MLETLWEIGARVVVENADVIVATVVGALGGWLGISKPQDKREIRRHYESVDRFWANHKPEEGGKND